MRLILISSSSSDILTTQNYSEICRNLCSKENTSRHFEVIEQKAQFWDRVQNSREIGVEENNHP